MGKLESICLNVYDETQSLRLSTLATLEELVRAGKVDGVALFEANAYIVHTAAKITKIIAAEK